MYKCYLKYILHDIINAIKPQSFIYFILIVVFVIPLAIVAFGGNEFHIILWWVSLITIIGSIYFYEYLKDVKRYCDRKIEYSKKEV